MRSFQRRPLLYKFLLGMAGVTLLTLFILACDAETSRSPLPVLQNKPQPVEVTFKGCQPEGSGGDPALNLLKNRVDEGAYLVATVSAIAQLPWPKGIERRNRADWSVMDAATVARYEGIPLIVEGYLVDAKEEGPESPNCDDIDHDFHIWLAKSAGDDRSKAIVTEATPRVRINHPGWRLELLRRIAHDRQRVRISGWLLLDPEHPDQVARTRSTIWEIHPIMQIEVNQQGRWVTLDSFAARPQAPKIRRSWSVNVSAAAVLPMPTQYTTAPPIVNLFVGH